MALVIMALCALLFEKFYSSVEIKRAHEVKQPIFVLKKMSKILRSLRSSKCLKTTVELTFTT